MCWGRLCGLLFVLTMLTPPTTPTLTLSCFSWPRMYLQHLTHVRLYCAVLDLPGLGFTPSSGIFLTSDIKFLTNLGTHTTAMFDACLWGLAR